MNHEISCDVIGDLYSVYSDGLCSDATRQLVETHLAECEHCRRLFADFPLRGTEPEPEPPDSEKAFRKLNRQLKMGKTAKYTAVLLTYLAFSIGLSCYTSIPRSTVYTIKGVAALMTLILFAVLLIATLVRTVLVAVRRIRGKIPPENRKSAYGSVLYLWLITALVFCASVVTLVFAEWG